MLKYLVPLLVFFCLIVLFIFGLQNDPRLVPSPFIGKPLPEVILPDLLDPDARIPTSAFRGEVTLLNIWATWCIPCRQEHALLVKLAEENDIKIVGLNYKDDRDAARNWLNELGNPYDLVLFDKEGTAGIDLGVYGVPETFVMDEKNFVRYKHIGPLFESDLDEKILPLVRELAGGR